MVFIYSILYLIIVVSLILMLFNSKFSTYVLIFVVLAPMSAVLPSESLLINGLNIIELLHVLFIVKCFLHRSSFRSSLPLSDLQKYAIYLTVFFIAIYYSTIHVKTYIFITHSHISFSKLIIHLIKGLLTTICIIMIIKCSNNPEVIKSIKKGLIWGFIFYGISVFFSEVFIELGLDIGDRLDHGYYKGDSIWLQRGSGLINGDGALAAHYFSLGAAFFLSIYEKSKRPKYILGIMLMFLATIYTASRTCSVILVLILSLYTLKNIRRNMFGTIVVFSLTLFLFYSTGNYLIERMFELGEGYYLEETGRFVYQSYYLNEMINNPKYFLTGYTERSSLPKWRNPHNQFFGTVYWGGLLYLFAFLAILFNIYRQNRMLNKSSGSITLLYVFIAFCFPYFFNPDSFILYFPIIISISQNYFQVNTNLKIN